MLERQLTSVLIDGEKNAPVVPGTEPYLKDVLDFLGNNSEIIRQIIFPDTDIGKLKDK